MIFGTHAGAQIDAHLPDLQGELEIVRMAVSNAGVQEILTYIVDGYGYVVIVKPKTRFETKWDESYQLDQFTARGQTDYNLLVKRLSDVAWHAQAVMGNISLKEMAAGRKEHVPPDENDLSDDEPPDDEDDEDDEPPDDDDEPPDEEDDDDDNEPPDDEEPSGV